MITVADAEFVNFVIDMKNSMHRLKTVFEFRERVEIKRRDAMRRLKKAFSDLNEEKMVEIIRSELMVYLNPANDADWLFAHQKYKESIPRVYRTAINVLDHHTERINSYILKFGNSDMVADAQSMITSYARMKELLQKKLLASANLQYKKLSELSQNLSIHSYREFLNYYELEYVAQREIYELGRLEISKKLKARKYFAHMNKRYGEIKDQNPMKFALFELSLTVLCVFTGIFVVKESMHFLRIFTQSSNLISTGYSIMDGVVDVVNKIKST